MGAKVYALDSTAIDLKGSIPSFIYISDVKVLDLLCEQGYIEASAFYVIYKAYVDFARLYKLHTARAFFVTRAKGIMQTDLIQTFPAGNARAAYITTDGRKPVLNIVMAMQQRERMHGLWNAAKRVDLPAEFKPIYSP